MILSLEIVTICENILAAGYSKKEVFFLNSKFLQQGVFFLIESWRYVILVSMSTAFHTQRCLFVTKIIVAGYSTQIFLDACASLEPTPMSPLVGWSVCLLVRHTFRFPLCWWRRLKAVTIQQLSDFYFQNVFL